MKKNVSSQVNDWATQRKQAIEKSKQLRDDRKYNLALAGEMSVGSASSSTTRRKLPSLDTQNRVGLNEYNQKKPASAKYGVSLVEYMPSEEEQMQAKSSLKLLKSKMRDVNGNPLDYYPERQKSRGYIDEETHEYMPYAPGERALEQDYDFNDVFHSGNPNYRKVFKPVFVDHNYPNPNFHMNRETFHQDQVFHKKASLLAHANRFGPPRENLHPPVYEPPQRVTEENNRRPPLGGSRFATKKGTNYTASSEDFSEIQSQNIPSRRPQKTIGSAKDKRPQMANSYEDVPKSQFSKQKYQSNKASLAEENNMDTEGFGYNNYSNYEYDPEAQYKSQAKPAQASRNAQKKVVQDFNYEDNEKEEKPTTFSKPNFKKKAPAKPKSPAKQDSKPLEQHELANLGGTVPAGANDSGEPLIECPEGCGRKFTEKVLEKHAKVCQKVFQSKRKKFDSAQQRADGLEETESDYPPRKGQKPPAYNSKSGAGPKKVPKWKAESESFRASMQAARS